jgi:hypothetical protein
VRGQERCRGQLLRLIAAQRHWLCSPTPLIVALGLVALPVGLAWLARARVLSADQLGAGLLQHSERYLPLWALLAGSVVWSDAEAEHRPFLFAWPVRAWELALAKLAAVALGYSLLAGAAALGLPALYAWATGEPMPAALPVGLLLVRTLLPAAMLLALAGIGGALGSPPAGLIAGAALWFPNLLDLTALWLDRHSAGLLNLFAWTRGSAVALDTLNQRQALVALGLGIAALLAPALGRLLAQRRHVG